MLSLIVTSLIWLAGAESSKLPTILEFTTEDSSYNICGGHNRLLAREEKLEERGGRFAIGGVTHSALYGWRSHREAVPLPSYFVRSFKISCVSRNAAWFPSRLPCPDGASTVSFARSTFEGDWEFGCVFPNAAKAYAISERDNCLHNFRQETGIGNMGIKWCIKNETPVQITRKKTTPSESTPVSTDVEIEQVIAY